MNKKEKTIEVDEDKFLTALMSEKSLAKLWNRKEEDKAWRKLKPKK